MVLKSFSSVIALILIGLVLLSLGACATTPLHLDGQNQDQNDHFLRKSETSNQYQTTFKQFSTQNTLKPLSDLALSKIILSKGDMLHVRFGDMSEYDGLYQVNANNELELPSGLNISVKGQTCSSLRELLETELVRMKWFYADSINIEISLVKMAPIEVAVMGAVFNPGRIAINHQPVNKPEDAIQQVSGAYASGRDLAAALVAAGGIRPDAELDYVYLKRDGKVIQLDLNKFMNGVGFNSTPSLVSGDIILVKSSGEEDGQLIKPSQITPPGMRVFMSNLTAPSLTNAQSAVGSDSTRLPYGSSLLDSAISANCVGGTHNANASRSLILVTRNYGSAQQIVIKRKINKLLANSSDSTVNPYLMPNDAIACYDSRFTNVRDLARGLVEIVSPLFLGGVL